MNGGMPGAESASRALGAATAATGAAVLAGWALDIPLLKSLYPSLISMKPNTALGFVLAGVAVWLSREGASVRARRAAQILGALVAALALASLSQDLFGFDLGIDQALFHDDPQSIGPASPGRMALATAVCFVLSALALLFLDTGRQLGLTPAQALALPSALISLVSVVGYIYGVPAFYHPLAGPLADLSSTAMAAHTAAAFVLLNAAILLSRPHAGGLRAFVGTGPSAVSGRIVFAATLLLPIVLGWARIEGERAGLYRTYTGVALHVVLNVVLLGSIVWWSAVRAGRLERALADSERHARQLLEGLPLLVWACRPDGPCDYLSPQWVAYTGIPEAEQLGSGWLDQIHPEDQQRLRAAWTEAVRAGANFDIDFRIRSASGAYRWFKTRALPFRDARGAIVRWFGTNTDIHDRITAEQEVEGSREKLRDYAAELQRSNRELEEFASVASHDLQEPLRKITAFGDRLRENAGPALDEQGRDFLARMQSAAGRLSALIESLLELSRITTRAQPFRPIDLNALAAEVVSDLEPRLREAEGRVEVCSLPTLAADAEQMRRLLQNLIGNALKFRHKDRAPLVTVAGRELSGGKVEISVSDNGIGFDEKYLDRIFKPFQRLHGRDEYEGNGMGLAICRKIAERHGGAIRATSTPGAGSSFRVVLPRTPPQERAAA